MSFLYPSFLWALLALAIPIIIHLFNFRKTTQVLFSNNRFLKEVKEATTAKRRLKHYLILFSRL
ncbi:MAG TPA: BatA domain-containing protein, partial [Chryseolinea sp.]|nr:BatA domain-containing protein [Chryseolinea sp.]